MIFSCEIILFLDTLSTFFLKFLWEIGLAFEIISYSPKNFKVNSRCEILASLAAFWTSDRATNGLPNDFYYQLRSTLSGGLCEDHLFLICNTWMSLIKLDKNLSCLTCQKIFLFFYQKALFEHSKFSFNKSSFPLKKILTFLLLWF